MASTPSFLGISPKPAILHVGIRWLGNPGNPSSCELTPVDYSNSSSWGAHRLKRQRELRCRLQLTLPVIVYGGIGRPPA